MEKIYTDQWTGLDPDPSGADSFTVEDRTSQLRGTTQLRGTYHSTISAALMGGNSS